MFNRTVFLIAICLLLLSLISSSQFITWADDQHPRLSSNELEIINLVNGTNAYDYALELENIALNRSISNYSFRSGGSFGATATANWIKEQFESFGLETQMESFNFTNWNLLSQPVLAIDKDGNQSTTADQTVIHSFWSEHLSWPTSKDGAFSDLVILPLPEARDHEEFGNKYYSASAWNAINTTGKVLLTGKEVSWDDSLHGVYKSKLQAEPPAAVILTWWYGWMSFTPFLDSSSGGRPAGTRGPYYWDLGIPVGFVNYEDGLWIRNTENTINLSAYLAINSVIDVGPHYNIVGKLQGSTNPERNIIFCGHYDTVMTPGFCDNGAGTSGVIELARVFAKATKEGIYTPQDSILFIALDSEELGLLGSINYAKQHETELKKIDAIINLDCIGNDILNIGETLPTNGLDLDEVALKVAGDLGVEARIDESDAADAEIFRNPSWANILHMRFWEVSASLSNATRVEACTAFSSSPTAYADLWYGGKPGWIHTEYDNSTSTATLGWVEVDHLEAHIQVAAITAMRFLSSSYTSFPLYVAGVAISLSVVVAVAIYFARSRVSILLKAIYDRGRDIVFFLGTKGFVSIAILLFFSTLISSVAGVQYDRIEVNNDGFPSKAPFVFWGFPFRLGGTMQSRVLPQDPETVAPGQAPSLQGGSFMILWGGLFLNVIIYFFLGFVLVYLVYWLKHQRELGARERQSI